MRPSTLDGVATTDAAREYGRKHYRENKQRYFDKSKKRRQALLALVAEHKARPCMDCGQSYPHYVMDLDHREPEHKVMNLARMASNGWSQERILAEITKCDVVCANCHRERSYKRSLEA